jgi:hypothetical protein
VCSRTQGTEVSPSRVLHMYHTYKKKEQKNPTLLLQGEFADGQMVCRVFFTDTSNCFTNTMMESTRKGTWEIDVLEEIFCNKIIQKTFLTNLGHIRSALKSLMRLRKIEDSFSLNPKSWHSFLKGFASWTWCSNILKLFTLNPVNRSFVIAFVWS